MGRVEQTSLLQIYVSSHFWWGHLTFYGKSRTTILESFIFIDFFFMPFHFFTILGITILQCSIAHEIQLPFNSAFRLTYASKAHAANSEGATNFSQGATCSLHAHVLLVSLFHLLQDIAFQYLILMSCEKQRKELRGLFDKKKINHKIWIFHYISIRGCQCHLICYFKKCNSYKNQVEITKESAITIM